MRSCGTQLGVIGSHLRRQVSDERGVALVMALGVMLCLSILLAVTIFFSTAGAQDAEAKNAGQKAYALAEAGLNSAFAQLAPHYPSASTAGSASWVASPGAKSYGGGTADYTGSYDSATQTWTLTGTGTVPSPTGASALVRTATARVPVVLNGSPAYLWGFFMGDPSAGCTTFDNGAAVKVSVYVANCLTFSNNAHISEPVAGGSSVDVYVGGLLNMGDSGNSSIGTSSTDRVRTVTAIGGCKYHLVTYPCSSSSSSQVWAQSYPTTTSSVSLPAIDLASTYASANWSAATCTVGTNPFDGDTSANSSRGTVRLLNGPSFDCTARSSAGATVGRLAWSTTTKTLTISGTVFIDAATLTFTNTDVAIYSGSGTIYVNGTVSFNNTSSICGPGTGSTASNGCPADAWDTTQGALMILAGNAANVNPAFSMNNSSMFEGVAYANGIYNGNNGAVVRGSVLAKRGQLQNSGGSKALTSIPPGAPGTAYQLGTATFG